MCFIFSRKHTQQGQENHKKLFYLCDIRRLMKSKKYTIYFFHWLETIFRH